MREVTSRKRQIAVARWALAVWLGWGMPPAQDVRAEVESPEAGSIVARVNARDDGGTMVHTIKMELIDRRGRTRERELRIFRRYEGEDRQSIVLFDQPRNLDGTAFLSFDYVATERSDDQWLYLPAARKSRRISASDRGNYFMGTDLTYEDIKNESKINQADYSFTTLGGCEIESRPCWRVEATPKTAEIASELGYGRLELWIDAEHALLRRFESFDVNGNPLKRVEFSDIRDVDGILTPHEIRALSHKSGHQTVLTSLDVKYREEIDSSWFHSLMLDRIP